MHELSIAQSLISSVVQEKQDRGLGPIRSVGLKIGELSGVLPEALIFCFDLAREGTPLEEAELKIEKVAARLHCKKCGTENEPAELVFLCPKCASGEIQIINGYELDIVYLEAEAAS